MGFSRTVGLLLTLGVVAAQSGCYDTGDGADPPLKSFYFPVGLQVSHGGNVLYVVNSDFDLQYNGGTLQSYDLTAIRRDAARVVDATNAALADPANPEAGRNLVAGIPFVAADWTPTRCPNPPDQRLDSDGRQPLGESCAPPVTSDGYVRDQVVIGAFATDLLLSPPPNLLPIAGERNFDRLFIPVRGNATLTWANVVRDVAGVTPKPDDTPQTYAPFALDCGQPRGAEPRCDGAHQAGDDPNEEGNSRHLTMPGEPFGMAMSEDFSSIVITHQNSAQTSLFSTGLSRAPEAFTPAIQFILDGVPVGGVGIATIPHDPAAFPSGTTFPGSAFLQTSRLVRQLSILRQYPDEGATLARPFLTFEAVAENNVSALGTDSRGVVIDPTPRIRCAARQEADPVTCARRPARVFVANRTPASVIVGTVGAETNGVYDPDAVTLGGQIPLSAGPSQLYLAPIVDRDGALVLRLFAVCFDSATLFVIDPDSLAVENIMRVGVGPFAMAFDPFTLEQVARNEIVPVGPGGVRAYRFGYIASFTNSYVQMLDLDNTNASPTFERIVFTLGAPTAPKGS